MKKLSVRKEEIVDLFDNKLKLSNIIQLFEELE
jgi:hypothetical protein